MRFMIIIKATEASERGEMPSAQLLEEMGKYNEELIRAGVLLAGEGLHPSSNGVRVKFRGRERTVVEGPFPTSELVAGFWLIDVKSKEEAIEWVKRIPNPMGEESVVEIRQVFDAADFGDLVNEVPEVFEREREYREQEEAARAERQRTMAG